MKNKFYFSYCKTIYNLQKPSVASILSQVFKIIGT